MWKPLFCCHLTNYITIESLRPVENNQKQDFTLSLKKVNKNNNLLFCCFLLKKIHHFQLKTCVCCLLISNLSCRKKCSQRWRSCGLGCFYRELSLASVAFIQLCRTSKFISISDGLPSYYSMRMFVCLGSIN